MKRLPEIIAAEFREMVGKTKRTYIHTGHKHHRQVIETSMATVEQHETLAARDAYASHGGWHAGRSTSCITYNDKGGVHSSVTYNIEE